MNTRVGSLRADEWIFAAGSKSVGKHCTGNHEGKRHTDKDKNKAVFGMLTISSFVPGLIDVRFVEH